MVSQAEEKTIVKEIRFSGNSMEGMELFPVPLYNIGLHLFKYSSF